MDDSITLARIKPYPLKTDADDSIWGTDQTLECGKFYQIISASGTGKSTLIGILSGIRADYSGNLFYGSSSLRSAALNQWISLRCAKLSVVYQDLKLFDSLTAMENITLLDAFRRPVNLFPVKDWIELLGMTEKMDTAVKFLSYGQKQRIAILRALNKDFRWLFLDEPFSHLDQVNLEIATQLIINECKSRNAGIVITGLDKRFAREDFISLSI